MPTKLKMNNLDAAFVNLLDSFKSGSVMSAEIADSIKKSYLISPIRNKNLPIHSRTIAAIAISILWKNIDPSIIIDPREFDIGVKKATFDSNYDEVKKAMEINDAVENNVDIIKKEDPQQDLAHPEDFDADEIVRSFRKDMESKATLLQKIISLQLKRPDDPQRTFKIDVKEISNNIKQTFSDIISPLSETISSISGKLESMSKSLTTVPIPDPGISGILNEISEKIETVARVVSSSATGPEKLICDRKYHMVYVDLNNPFMYSQAANVYFSIDWLFNKINESLAKVKKDYETSSVIGSVYCGQSIAHLERELDARNNLLTRPGLEERFKPWHVSTRLKMKDHRKVDQNMDNYIIHDATKDVILRRGFIASIHIVGGDMDLIPLVNFIKESNIYTCIISYRKSLSHEIQSYANKVTYIDSE